MYQTKKINKDMDYNSNIVQNLFVDDHILNVNDHILKSLKSSFTPKSNQNDQYTEINSSFYNIDEYGEKELLKLQDIFRKHIELTNSLINDTFGVEYSNSKKCLITSQELLTYISDYQHDFLKVFKSFLIENENYEGEYININLGSFINYLYISISKKLNNKYSISINDDGCIVIHYNEHKNRWDSKKITIVVNETNFLISILSRKNGLAKFSGICTLKYPDGYYKFDSALRGLI